ncbi:MAG TPA: thiamine pyrophosphate-requiring protein [Polyangiaceae bacterium]|nr:thiamine pyrophosphate-requiring protein [Polyangiaceae bacterium]
MAKTVSDHVIERLASWGVRRIYGYPGDGINGLMGAMNKDSHGIDFVQARHEELAAFMACAHAKFTGEVGVCMATSGPGAIHLLNGLYDAKMDHQPVVAIVGQQSRSALGGDYQQEVDLISLFKDVAHEYVHMATTPAQIRHLIDRAVRVAKASRSVTCVIVPNDLQNRPAKEIPPREHGTVHSGIGYCSPLVVPKKKDLEAAAAILNEGKRVAMLVGAGALGATEEVVHVADLLGAGIAKALLGVAAVPDDVPFCTGTIGLLGTKPTADMMNDCDTLLMVGSSFPYSEFLPVEGQARGVQIDIDGRLVGIRYPMELNLVGDAKETLRALAPLLRRKENRGFQDKLVKGVREWRKLLDERALTRANPVNPQYVFRCLSDRLPDDCIVTADSGSGTNWFARDLRFRRGMMASLSGNLATMGPGVPYAISAKFAFPDRTVIACVGDGAMQMNGINGLITISKYYKEWRNPRLITLVLNNRDLNQVTWEQRVMEGDAKYSASQDLPDFQYAEYGKQLGLDGTRVTSPEEVERAIDAALSANKPFVLEIMSDPDVPPLPPHITFEQAASYASAMLSGDPDTEGFVRRSLSNLFPSLAPKTKG